MISSIFERTNPINFIILCVFISLFLVGGFFLYLDVPYTPQVLIKLIQSLILILSSLFLIDFINRKNFLTKSNSFTLFFFAFIFCLFPKIFNQTNLLISNVFVLISFRRLVSIRSNKDVEIKIFDASLWIFVATFFYSWSLLFILLVFAGIFLYKKNNYRNLLIPFVALSTTLVLVFAFYYLTNRLEKFYSLLYFLPEFTIEKYEDIRYVISLLFISVIGIWATISFFFRKQSKSFVTRVPGILIFFMLILAILVAIISESANTSEVIFFIFPLSVIIAKNVESITNLWVKEIFIWLFIIVPFVVLFL